VFAVDFADEYVELRRAIWACLTAAERGGVNFGKTKDILRLDEAIAVATLSTMRGYHWKEFQNKRKRSDVIAETLEYWDRTVAGRGLNVESYQAGPPDSEPAHPTTIASRQAARATETARRQTRDP